MFAYYLLVGVPLLWSLLMSGIQKKYRLEKPPYSREVLRLFFLILFLLLAFRAEEVGSDTWNYLGKFQNARRLSWSAYVGSHTEEHGYAILTKLIGTFTGNGQIFLAVVALITVYPIAKWYMEESEAPMLTISLYLILPMFPMLFSGLRQAIAMAFVPAAYYSVRDKKMIRFILLVGIASLFHESAWLILFLYPVYHIRMPRRALIWVVPALTVLFLFREQIYLFLYTWMISVFYEGHGEIVDTGAYTMLGLFTLILAFSYFALGNTDKETSGFRNILVFSVAIQCFALLNRIAMRANYYFLLFLPLLLPKVIQRIPQKNKWFGAIVEYVCCAFFLVYFFWKGYQGESGLGIYPYVPFWNG